MKCDRLLFIIIFLILFSTIANAAEGHIKLLAVAESDSGYVGKIADLYLEVLKGKGRVFLDTYPLTKFDTQISTRFAKQISCDFLEADCTKYDFIYTIKSDSGIIGGPSAGGATAILTTAMLKGLDLKQDVAMTGTINSGGLIGPVSGLVKKLEAASQNDINIVLIPKGSRYISLSELEDISIELPEHYNGTELDLVEYGKSLGLEVVEISRLSEAMEYFTGTPFIGVQGILSVNMDYLNTMRELSTKLCTRSKSLQKEVNELTLDQSLEETKKEANDLIDKSVIESDEAKFYSAASRCFAANIKYAYIKKKVQNTPREKIIDQAKLLKEKILRAEENLLNRELDTIMDLQAFMVVKERLEDAKNYAVIAQETGSEYDYVFGIERYESAEAWSEFFGKRGMTYTLNKESLKDSCYKKLSEAQERIQYVSFYIPNALESTRESLSKAEEYAESEEYVLCLFKASKTKAEADSLYSVLSVPENQIKDIINAKLEIAKDIIIKESKLGSFPILAYSYYEYTQELVEEDLYSALLYSQYALELGNLRMYFTQSQNPLTMVIESDYRAFSLFLGLLIGILIGYYYRCKS